MALVGITGSGKSALLQLVPRLYDVTRRFHHASTAWTCASSASRICAHVVAVAFEDTTLFSSSVRDNVLLGASGPGTADAREDVLAEALDVAQAHFAYSLPDGRGHPDRRGGTQPVRRPAAAHRPGPGHRGPALGAGPGRPALGPGREHRGARGRPAAGSPGQHHHPHRRPPAVHRGAGRPGGAAGGRPDRRRRNACRTAGREQPLPLT